MHWMSFRDLHILNDTPPIQRRHSAACGMAYVKRELPRGGIESGRHVQN
jgi:hypothetical protein